MKRTIVQLILFALVLMTASTVFAKKSPDEVRAKLDEMSVQVLERMYQKYPSSEESVKNAYAYCTISASAVKWGLIGDDHGRGVAVNKQTNERIYMKMKEVTLGINVGAKEYDLLFVIQNKEAWERFISGSIKFGGEASAQASDGVSGGTVADASILAKGVWVYQLDKKGLAVELSFKGMRISPFRSLNPKKSDENQDDVDDIQDNADENQENLDDIQDNTDENQNDVDENQGNAGQ